MASNILLHVWRDKDHYNKHDYGDNKTLLSKSIEARLFAGDVVSIKGTTSNYHATVDKINFDVFSGLLFIHAFVKL